MFDIEIEEVDGAYEVSVSSGKCDCEDIAINVVLDIFQYPTTAEYDGFENILSYKSRTGYLYLNSITGGKISDSASGIAIELRPPHDASIDGDKTFSFTIPTTYSIESGYGDYIYYQNDYPILEHFLPLWKAHSTIPNYYQRTEEFYNLLTELSGKCYDGYIKTSSPAIFKNGCQYSASSPITLCFPANAGDSNLWKLDGPRSVILNLIDTGRGKTIEYFWYDGSSKLIKRELGDEDNKSRLTASDISSFTGPYKVIAKCDGSVVEKETPRCPTIESATNIRISSDKRTITFNYYSNSIRSNDVTFKAILNSPGGASYLLGSKSLSLGGGNITISIVSENYVLSSNESISIQTYYPGVGYPGCLNEEFKVPPFTISGNNTITPIGGKYVIPAEEAKTSKTLHYKVGNFEGNLIIPAFANSSCCNIVYTYWSEGLELHVIIHEAEFPVVVTVSDVPPQTAAAADVELIFVLPQAGNYTITPICDGFPDCFTELPITVEECELTVDLMASSIGCDYIATASEANCACDNGYVTIDNIVVTNHPGGVVDPEDPYHSDYVELTYRLLVSMPNVDAGSNGISELTISIPGEIDGGHDEVTQVGEYFSGYSNFDGFQCYNGEYPCDNCAYGNLTINLRLEDGCEYTGSFILYLCRGGERIYSPNFSTSFNLVPSGSKSPQFNWSVNGNSVKIEHETGISPTSTLSTEEATIEPGDSVEISLSCGGCTATASTNECLSTEITNIELSELNSHVYFELDTCYLNSIVSVSLYDCGNNLIDIVTTSGSNLNDGYTFELGSSLCMGTSKLTYAFYGSGCVGEVEFDVPELSSESSSISSSVSSSISSSISSSQSSSISSSVSPSSSVSSSVSPSSSVSSSTSPSQSVSSSISPSASISSSPSTSLSPSFSISSSPSLGSSPSSSISSSVSPSSSISSSLSPSSSISSSVSSSVSSSPSSSLSPSSSTSSSPSSSISSSISSSESSSISPSSSISSSISSSPSSSYSPSESISSSPSSGTSASSSISSSVSPSSSRSSSVSSSRSSSRSSSVSPSSSRSSSVSSSRSSSRSSSVSPSSSRSSSVSSSPSSSRSSSISPSTSISNSPSSSRSSSRSSSISSSPSVPPDLCDCYTGTITLASVSCHLGNCWFFGSATFTRLNSACPSLLSYTESDFIMTGSFYGMAANSISGTADEIGVEFSMNLSGEAGSCGDQTVGLYGIDVVGDDACLFDTQFVPMTSCIGSCTPPCLP